jgi:hypothetical protein
MTFKEKINKLCEPYSGDQITTKNVHGRNESWVEQHHIFDRLNSLAIPYTWEILKDEATEVSVGGGGKPGQHAYAKGRITLKFTDGDLFYEGVGEATMVGFTDARKAAASKAFRHAAKPFTTFLWGGGMVNSEPEEVQRVEIKTPTTTAVQNPEGWKVTRTPEASTQSKTDDIFPEYATDKMREAVTEWNQVMGKIGDSTTMPRVDFESAIWRAVTKEEYNGTWQSAVSRGYKTFFDFATGKTANGKFLVGPSFYYKNDAKVLAERLESGEDLELVCLTSKSGNTETIVVPNKANQREREALEIAKVAETLGVSAEEEVPSDVPF